MLMKSPVHLNNNLLCAIDIETSGLRIPGLWTKPHDLLQIAVIPVTADYRPSKEHRPFHLKLQPKRPENCDEEAEKVNRGMLKESMLNGMEPWTAVERFGEWFERLKLPPGKKIIPLGANYDNFDKLFIIDWLGGPLSYDEFFRSDSRDPQKVVFYLNDVADMFSEVILFPKWNLPYMAAMLGVEHPAKTAHDALNDCVATIECYKRLLKYRDHFSSMGIGGNPLSSK